MGPILVSAQQGRPTRASSSRPLPFRPIGSPSLVDQFERGSNVYLLDDRGRWQSRTVRQTDFTVPAPDDPNVAGDTERTGIGNATGIGSPTTSPILPRSGFDGATVPAVGEPIVPTVPANGLTDDRTPMSAPSLDNSATNFATLGNSPLVTAPTGYAAQLAVPVASSGRTPPGGLRPVGFCQGTMAPATVPATMVPASTVPPTVVTPGVVPGGPLITPTVPAATAAPAGPLISLGQERFPIEVGRGLVGQPKAYVDGQPIRNWLRYLTP